MNRRDPPPSQRKLDRPDWFAVLWYLPFVLLLLWIWQSAITQMTVRTISYSEFKNYLHNGEVVQASIKEDAIDGKIQPKAETKAEPTTSAADEKKDSAPAKLFLFRTIRVEDPKLAEELTAAGVKYEGVRPSILTNLLFSWIVPIGVILLIWVLISRRLGRAGESILSFGKSRARLLMEKDTGVTFNHVAGCEEAKYELKEVIDFLKNPQRYKALGAKIPKGVLLVGPPGTGKTLLARAVAGEARVPFFWMSGSDFVEMFVGVGASRVRDLFQQAKGRAPSIIFIDELDAIGRQRGVHVGVVNDEREQTLNQLLVELDGFEANAGVIVLAATNRPDVLDRALLRPGRFDRQIVVDAPDIDGREAVLKVHTRKLPLGPDVNLRKIAQATPGMSGADLANAANEAALLAARHGAKVIAHHHMEEAVEKVVAGPERKSRRLTEDTKHRVAYHEVGHALVAAYSKHGDPIHKISIIPRGRAALGYTMQLPAEEQLLMTRVELLDRIRGLLGGRAAEELVLGEVSTGAESDLERATALARQMVCLFGMSGQVGLARVAQRQPGMFLPGQDGNFQRDCSERTAEQIDEEVKRILDRAYAEAKEILALHRDQMDLLAAELLKSETLDGTRFRELIGQSPESDEKPAVELAPEMAGKI